MKKKLLAVLMCLVLVVVMAMPALAAESNGYWIEGETIVVELTYDEYIDRVAELNSISREEAIELYQQSNTLPTTRVDVIDHYQSVSKTFVFSANPMYQANFEATVHLRGKGSYFQIVGINGCATRMAAGTTTATWNQLYASCSTTAFPCTSVDFVGRGYFTEARTHSIGLSIPGFVFTGSSGLTQYYNSNSMDLIWTYNSY